MRVTIKDVAKLANVSPSTISLILNNKPVPISQKTREKVLKIAKQLNYRPNQLAVGLVTSKTNSIGLIIPDNSNPFFASLSNCIEKNANSNGYSVILGNSNNDAKAVINYLQIFTDHQVDGIVLAQTDFSDPEETTKCNNMIHELKIPIVLVDRVSEDSHVNSVMVDQIAAGYLATKHLLELGHRRIGCAAGSFALLNCKNRLIGYKKALAEYNVPFDSGLLYEEALNIECGIHSLPYLLGKNVTAVFAFNDLIAYGIYKELRNYNLHIPDDLSVVGIDDIFLSNIIQPPLTTVAQPIEESARLVVEHLVELIKEPNATGCEPVILAPTLKVRGSSKKLITL